MVGLGEGGEEWGEVWGVSVSGDGRVLVDIEYGRGVILSST